MSVEAFSITPKAAVDFFKQKGLKPSFAWQDMLHQEHSRNFTVAKMLDMALLKDVHDEVEAAIEEGMTLHQFRERLEPLMQEKGWWGRKEVVDPETGEIVEAQLGSPRRLQTIFETNLKTAYAAGRWDTIKETAAIMPYLMYSAVKDDQTRDEHLAWDGIVLRWDDPWWESHYPPNGWNCRCSVIQVSDRTLSELGKDGPDEAPQAGTYEWENPRTGEVSEIPDGIDPGWDYNPGKGRNDDDTEMLLERINSVPAELGAEAWSSMPEEEKERSAEAFADWASGVIESQKPEGVMKPVGVIEPEIVAGLKEFGVEPESSLISVSDRALLHMVREAKEGKSLAPETLSRMPEIIAQSGAVLWDTKDPAMLYVFDYEDNGRVSKFVMRVNTHTQAKGPDGKKTKTVANTIVTGGKVNLYNLQGDNRYRVIKGKL